MFMWLRRDCLAENYKRLKRPTSGLLGSGVKRFTDLANIMFLIKGMFIGVYWLLL